MCAADCIRQKLNSYSQHLPCGQTYERVWNECISIHFQDLLTGFRQKAFVSLRVYVFIHKQRVLQDKQIKLYQKLNCSLLKFMSVKCDFKNQLVNTDA